MQNVRRYGSFLCSRWDRIHLTPISAPACAISGMKDARTHLKQYIFQSYSISTFNAMRFDENPFTCLCEKENKKASGFEIWHFYWSLSSDLMAMQGLTPRNAGMLQLVEEKSRRD